MEAMNVSPSPAPVVKTVKTKVEYEEIERAARCSALWDFDRQRKYWLLKREIKEKGLDVSVIPVNEALQEKLVRRGTTRLLKEYDSASWSTFFYQTGVFGLMGVSLVATCGALYMGLYRNRMFLPVVPVGAAMTWRLWTVLEDTWSYQRYVDNAAKIRNERVGNPMNTVVKRRVKTEIEEVADDGSHHGTAVNFE